MQSIAPNKLTLDVSMVLKKMMLFFLIISLLYFGKELLMPILLGGVIASLFLPFCNWMEAHKIPKGIAVFICLFILLVFISLIGFLFGWQISAFANDFVLIKQKAIEIGLAIQQFIFNHLGIAIEKQSQILETEQPSITVIMQTVLGSVKYLFVNLILVLAYIFLLLFYRSHIRNFIIKITPVSQRTEMEHIVHSTTRVAQQYLFGLAKIIGCLWIMYGIGFGILGVHNFIFFAILCGILEIVPFIGNITGTLITLMVAAMHGSGLPILVGIVIIYGVIQFIQGWMLEPLILGPQVKINPFFTIVALLFGEFIWGIPGIILAIPLTAMIKIICDHVDPLKPYGFLIGEIETTKTDQITFKKIKHWFN